MAATRYTNLAPTSFPIPISSYSKMQIHTGGLNSTATQGHVQAASSHTCSTSKKPCASQAHLGRPEKRCASRHQQLWRLMFMGGCVHGACCSRAGHGSHAPACKRARMTSSIARKIGRPHKRMHGEKEKRGSMCFEEHCQDARLQDDQQDGQQPAEHVSLAASDPLIQAC